jgi:glycosyltransferase involved in cell wall biosynthesis
MVIQGENGNGSRPLGENGNGSRPLHVLEIVGNGIVGGMETYVRNLIRGLPRDRFRVTCLCPYESAFTRAVRQAGGAVFITTLRDDPLWHSLQLAVQLIRGRQIDVIHAHLPNAHMLAGLAGRLTQTPAVATIHGMRIPILELEISRMTGTHLLLVCQAAYAEAMALGVPAERLHLIPNGVDTDRFAPDRGGEAFRQALGVPPGAPLVGFVARLAPEKGPDQFVRVAQLVRGKRSDVHFTIVGEGPMEGQVAAMVQHMGLDGCVHMAGLRMDMWDVYPAFDVLVQTSRSEGMPLVLLESMASGRPAVAMDVGGVAEIMENGTTGLLVPPGDCEALAEVLFRLLARPVQLRRMGEAARRRAEEVFPLQASMRRIGALLASLTGQPSGLQALARAE